MSKKTGFITCGICKKEVVRGQYAQGFFCRDAQCINSEDNYLKD